MTVTEGRSSSWLAQLVRYTIVGTASFALDLAVLMALVEWAGAHYLVSSVIGYLLALMVDYCASVLWVFSHRSKRDQKLAEFVTFAVVGLAGLGVNTLVIYLCTDIMALHYALSKLAAGLCVLLFTFVLRRHLLFTKRRLVVSGRRGTRSGQRRA